MADLWDRLRAAQARIEEPALPAEEPPVPGAAEVAPDGWRWVTPLVACRVLEFDLDPGFWRVVGARLNPDQWLGVLCFDTETTGLSGGAGTVPFLVGWAELVRPWGRPVPGVRLSQWFLRDLPGEPGLIEAVEGPWNRATAVVSFNGASYDLPLLRSRWVLVGKTLVEPPHRDDLHPSRRLWRRLLDNCRLSHLEETVLGLHRVGDVPGSLVPALWFDYLRQGAANDFVTPLGGVLQHHAQDVYSLLCLDLLLAALRADPTHPRWTQTLDPFPVRSSVARPVATLPPSGLLHPDLGPTTPVDFWGLLALREEQDAGRALEAAWTDLDDEAVGLAWADRLKRRGDVQAVEIWSRLWETRRSYPALEELLKWWEHRDRSPKALDRALHLATEGLKAPFLPRRWQEALERRRARLVRKAEA